MEEAHVEEEERTVTAVYFLHSFMLLLSTVHSTDRLGAIEGEHHINCSQRHPGVSLSRVWPGLDVDHVPKLETHIGTT